MLLRLAYIYKVYIRPFLLCISSYASPHMAFLVQVRTLHYYQQQKHNIEMLLFRGRDKCISSSFIP